MTLECVHVENHHNTHTKTIMYITYKYSWLMIPGNSQNSRDLDKWTSIITMRALCGLQVESIIVYAKVFIKLWAQWICYKWYSVYLILLRAKKRGLRTKKDWEIHACTAWGEKVVEQECRKFPDFPNRSPRNHEWSVELQRKKFTLVRAWFCISNKISRWKHG